MPVAPPRPTPSVPPAHARPLLVVERPRLLDHLLRLCAVAGVEPLVVSDAARARSLWTAAPVTFVDRERAPSCRSLPRCRHLVLVDFAEPGPGSAQRGARDELPFWQLAVDLGAACVVNLPEGEQRLLDELARALEAPGSDAPVIGVMGARGGAGATSLAVALASTSARLGHRTLLLDADPLGGGIDLAVGAEAVAGLRWPDLLHLSGRLPPDALAEALPSAGDLLVLSWDRGDPVDVPPAAATAVMAGARRAVDVVVLDLPRGVDLAAAVLLEHCDVVLLLVPAEVRAAAAAARVGPRLATCCADVRLVVRGPAPGGLPAAAVGEALGLPVAGVLKPEPGIAAALERGEPPGGSARGPLARFCTQFLTGLLDAGRAAA